MDLEWTTWHGGWKEFSLFSGEILETPRRRGWVVGRGIPPSCKSQLIPAFWPVTQVCRNKFRNKIPTTYCFRIVFDLFLAAFDVNNLSYDTAILLKKFFIVANRYESAMNATMCIILWWVVFFYTAEYRRQFSSCAYFNRGKYYSNSKRRLVVCTWFDDAKYQNIAIYQYNIILRRKFANRQIRYYIFTNNSVTIR